MENQVFNRRIGKNIKSIRRAHGYTQDELAQKMDIPVKSVQDIETGALRLNLYEVCQILTLFKDVHFENIVVGVHAPVAESLTPQRQAELEEIIQKAIQLAETQEGQRILRSIKYLIN